MRPIGCVLLCCLFFTGCRTAEPHASVTPNPPAENATEPPAETATRPPETRGRFERMRETVAVEFFTGLEQVGQVVAFPFQMALTGLYVLFFPVIGFGHGGPG